MNLIEKYISRFLKAHAAGVGAALTLLLADLQNGHGNISLDQGLAVLAAYLGVGAAVSVVPNSRSNSFTPDAGLAPDATPTSDAQVQDDGTND